jgi:glycosyltransferase involved in cell wall biosynthesis
LTQDFPHDLLELIVVDDGSTDKTATIVKKHMVNSNVRIRLFERNWAGLGSSRNLIVNNALGKYIIWVDADMILPVDHVRIQVKFLDNNPLIGVAKARYAQHPEENWVGFLENAAYQAVDSKYKGITTRTLGTGGSIYRTEAIRQVGGFDENIQGAGEDMDAEFRIRKKGWFMFLGSNAYFYERRRKTWVALWKEAYWHGYNVHYISKKNPSLVSLPKLSPFGGLIAGIFYSGIIYKLQFKMRVFLLPAQYTFKRIAWFLGFTIAQIRDIW